LYRGIGRNFKQVKGKKKEQENVVRLGDMVLREAAPTKACKASSGSLFPGTARLFLLSYLFQIVHGAKKIIDSIAQLAKTEVATAAQKTANDAPFMTMIHNQGGWGTTDGTYAFLLGKDYRLHFRGKTIHVFFVNNFSPFGFTLSPFATQYVPTDPTITLPTIQCRGARRKINQGLDDVTACALFLRGRYICLATFCKSCFRGARMRAEEAGTLFTDTVDFTIGFFNQNTTTCTGYESCCHSFNLLFFLLRSIPICGFAFRTISNFGLARDPLISATQAFQFFDFYNHDYEYTQGVEMVNSKKERKAAILRPVLTDRLAA
jgi:hypothetical protein